MYTVVCPNCNGAIATPIPQIICPYCQCNFVAGCQAPQYPTPSNQVTPSDQVTLATQQLYPDPPVGYCAHIDDVRGKPCEDWNWRFMLQLWLMILLTVSSWIVTIEAYEYEHGEGSAERASMWEVMGPGLAVTFFNIQYLQYSSLSNCWYRNTCFFCNCIRGDCCPFLTPTVVHEAREMKSAMIMLIPNGLVIAYDGYELFKSAEVDDWKFWVGILILILRSAAWVYVAFTKRKGYLVFLHDNKIYDPNPELCACVSCLEPTPVGDDVEGKSSTFADSLEIVTKVVR